MIKRFIKIPWRKFFPVLKFSARSVCLSSNITSPIPRFTFSTSRSIDPLEEEWELLEQLPTKKCEGCGVKMQHEDSEKQGYIPRERALKVLKHNKRVQEQPFNLGENTMSLRAQRLLKDKTKGLRNQGSKQENVLLGINDVDVLDSLEGSNMMTKTELVDAFENNKLKRLICYRCHSLKNKSEVDESIKARKRTSYAIPAVEPERIFKDIFVKVKKGSTILHIVSHKIKDLTDFSATISNDIIEAARKKGCKVLLAVNKVDVMPSQLSEARIKYWIRMRASELGIRIMPEHIFLLSSKNGFGIDKLAGTLRSLAKKTGRNYRDLYLIGHTNAGKSSLINRLIKDSNRYEKDVYRDPFENKGDKKDEKSKDGKGDDKDSSSQGKIKLKSQEEPVRLFGDLDDPDKKVEAEAANKERKEDVEEAVKLDFPEKVEEDMEHDVQDENEFKLTKEEAQDDEGKNSEAQEEEEFKIEPEKEPLELTVSPFHGTTLELVKVEDLHLGWRIWDTPGIPNLLHISTFMEDQKDTTKLLHHKRVSPEKFIIRSETSLWIGALARLDFSEGDEICAVVYTSNGVSLHKTHIAKSNMLYLSSSEILVPVLRQDITKTVFRAHTVEVECDEKGIGNVEIDIFGLGWIGFYSHIKKNAKTTFTLYLPQEVGFTVREALINFDDKSVLPASKRHVRPEVKEEREKKKERY